MDDYDYELVGYVEQLPGDCEDFDDLPTGVQREAIADGFRLEPANFIEDFMAELLPTVRWVKTPPTDAERNAIAAFSRFFYEAVKAPGQAEAMLRASRHLPDLIEAIRLIAPRCAGLASVYFDRAVAYHDGTADEKWL